MLEHIKKCTKCGLCQNQPPLLDDYKDYKNCQCQVFWVGLSAKKATFENERPLSITTNSGKLLSLIEERCVGIQTYRTNLVKCVPLNDNLELRYPNKKEMDTCFSNLKDEIELLKPKIVFLLGNKVAETVSRHYIIDFDPWDGFNYKCVIRGEIYYVPIHHPSYIYVYKRKQIEDYVIGVSGIIEFCAKG